MTIFTAFRECGFLSHPNETLDEFLRYVEAFGETWNIKYDAWQEGATSTAHDEDRLLAIAAGRALTQVDGKYTAGGVIGPFGSGSTLLIAGDKIVGRIAPEPLRDPLTWDTATVFDTFGPDFIVTKGAEPTAPLYDSPTTDSAYPAIAGLLRG